jgi:hypothetical protein
MVMRGSPQRPSQRLDAWHRSRRPRSSVVIGCASDRPPLRAAISAAFIGRMDVSGTGRSLPSLSTSTTVPSERIFALGVVLLMFFRLSGRD